MVALENIRPLTPSTIKFEDKKVEEWAKNREKQTNEVLIRTLDSNRQRIEIEFKRARFVHDFLFL